MVKFLKKIAIEQKNEREDWCVIPVPPKDNRILVKIRDKETIIQHSSYFFLDEITQNLGNIFVWNNYRHCAEKIKVSLVDETKYLLKLPDNMIVDAAYY